MLDRNKVYIGQYTLILVEVDTVAGTNYILFKKQGLKHDSLTVNEEVTTEDIEDGSEIQLKRLTDVQMTMSEIDSDDMEKLQKIQEYNSSNEFSQADEFATDKPLNATTKQQLLIQFPKISKELFLESDPGSDSPFTIKSELSDNKTQITFQQSGDINSSNITTQSKTDTSGYDDQTDYQP